MSMFYSSREPMTALGKPCLILNICHFLSWPLAAFNQKDVTWWKMENDQPHSTSRI